MRRDVGTVYVQMFDVALANWYGEPRGMCVHSETCGRRSRWSTPATCTPATTTSSPASGWATSRASHGRAGRLARSSAVRPGQAGHAAPVLPGLRRAVRLPRRLPEGPLHDLPDGEPGQHYLCPGYKVFFHHVQPMDDMSGLLRTGRAPSELWASYAAQDARRGRNDPCTCGSGRKWKRCHGATYRQLGKPDAGQARRRHEHTTNRDRPGPRPRCRPRILGF